MKLCSTPAILPRFTNPFSQKTLFKVSQDYHYPSHLTKNKKQEFLCSLTTLQSSKLSSFFLMQSSTKAKLDPDLYNTHFSTMLKFLNRRLKSLRHRLRCHSKSRISITPKNYQSTRENGSATEKPIRVATFNAALFSMAPAVPFDRENGEFTSLPLWSKSFVDRPRSILKQSPLHPLNGATDNNNNNNNSLSTKQQKFAKSKLRVSINLPDNEISRQLSFREENERAPRRSPLRSAVSFSTFTENKLSSEGFQSTKSVLEVLRELDADVLALQDVKAEEANEMRPLSDLAAALGMNYVFAESWAPEYGNAVLSKWPIKKWRVRKIYDDSDFRNVLKATIEVPQSGEVEFHCTHLDHLDENWRMKQMNAIIQSSEGPHILAGGINSLDETDYSSERWTDIIKYYEEMGKPTPKAEVMRFLKSKQYTDSKDFAGECESVVVIAKGQSVQGTCKYGTRVDYVLASPNSPYKFVPGSYSVFSSKGTSDHHIVKVDVVKVNHTAEANEGRNRTQTKQKVVKRTTNSSSSPQGIWKARA